MNYIDKVNAVVNQVMQEWQVPGIALAIVQNGSVILSKGYGFRNLQRKFPVTEKTLFPIASTTKSFTATLMAMLIDEGKLDRDTPVYKILPEFKLSDDLATQQVTVHDLLTHCSGMPRHDGIWYSSNFSRTDLINRLQYLQLNKKVKESFQYNNLMYMLAGYGAGKINNCSWEELVEQKICRSLGMDCTNFSVHRSQVCDFALPYKKIDDAITQIPFRYLEHIGPAGAINSNLDDMSKYLLFHMRQVKNQTALAEIYKPQIHVPEGLAGLSSFKEFGETYYGMGFAVRSYREYLLIEHGGAIDGFRSEFAFMPDKDIGVVILSNADGFDFNPAILVYSIFDCLLDLPELAWSQRFKELNQNLINAQQQEKENQKTLRKLNTFPSCPLHSYVANYEHPAYGNIYICLEQDVFKIKLNEVESCLQHFQDDTFEIMQNDHYLFQNQHVQFHLDESASIDSLSIILEPSVEKIKFNRAK